MAGVVVVVVLGVVVVSEVEVGAVEEVVLGVPVMVHAMGLVGVPPVRQFQVQVPVWLVEVEDRGCSMSLARSQQRQQQYLPRGRSCSKRCGIMPRICLKFLRLMGPVVCLRDCQRIPSVSCHLIHDSPVGLPVLRARFLGVCCTMNMSPVLHVSPALLLGPVILTGLASNGFPGRSPWPGPLAPIPMPVVLIAGGHSEGPLARITFSHG